MIIRVIFLLVTSYWLLVTSNFAMDTDLWNLPLPAESEVVWRDKPLDIIGIKARGIHLHCQLPAPEIVNFYKDTLEKSNWQLKESFREEVFVFTKENNFLYVLILNNTANLPCDVYLVKSPSSLAICNVVKDYLLKKDIAEDVPGKDFSDVPRYPGSKRRLDIFTPLEGAVLMYETESPAQEIASFYRQHLKAQGWEEERYLNQGRVREAVGKIKPELKDAFNILCFYRGDDALIINITPAPENFPLKEEISGRNFIIITKNIAQELAYPRIEQEVE